MANLDNSNSSKQASLGSPFAQTKPKICDFDQAEVQEIYTFLKIELDREILVRY